MWLGLLELVFLSALALAAALAVCIRAEWDGRAELAVGTGILAHALICFPILFLGWTDLLYRPRSPSRRSAYPRSLWRCPAFKRSPREHFTEVARQGALAVEAALGRAPTRVAASIDRSGRARRLRRKHRLYGVAVVPRALFVLGRSLVPREHRRVCAPEPRLCIRRRAVEPRLREHFSSRLRVDEPLVRRVHRSTPRSESSPAS